MSSNSNPRLNPWYTPPPGGHALSNDQTLHSSGPFPDSDMTSHSTISLPNITSMSSYASTGHEGSPSQPAHGAPVYNSDVSPRYPGWNAPSFVPVSDTVYGEYAPPHGHPSMHSSARYPTQPDPQYTPPLGGYALSNDQTLHSFPNSDRASRLTISLPNIASMLSYASTGHEGSPSQPAHGAPVYNTDVSPRYPGWNAPSFVSTFNTVYGEYAPPHGHPSMNSSARYPTQPDSQHTPPLGGHALSNDQTLHSSGPFPNSNRASRSTSSLPNIASMLSYASTGHEGSPTQPAYSLGAPVYNSNVSPYYPGNAPSFVPASTTVYGEYASPHGHPSTNSTAGYPTQPASTSLLPTHPRHPPHLVDSMPSRHQRSESNADAIPLQHQASLAAANVSQPGPVMGQGSRGRTRTAGTQDHRSLLPPVPPTPRTLAADTVADPVTVESGPTLGRNFPNNASSFRFTHQQRDVLRELYSRKKYPSRDELVQLARQLDAPERSVDAWFRTQRTRTKDPREKTEIKRSDRPKQAEGTIIADEQARLLRDAFERDSSLDRDKRMKLARQLGLREQVIEDWFLRRRREKIALEDNKAARS